MLNIRKSYTFDDVLLIPQRSEILPSQVDLGTRITKNIALRIPLLSAAMDTVTEHELAVAIAREGGIGILHKNLTIEEQAAEVTLVKRAESGVITIPYTISPEDSLATVTKMKEDYKVGSFPVIEDGKLVGILTNPDSLGLHSWKERPLRQVPHCRRDKRFDREK
jgi:IMP dehydrogenase